MVEDIMRTRRERSGHVQRLITLYLRQCYAANLTGMAQALGLSPSRIRGILKVMVRNGRVRVMRPVQHSKSSAAIRVQSSRQHDPEYYRLIQPSDERYLWQQQFSRRVAAHRMYDLQQTDALTEI